MKNKIVAVIPAYNEEKTIGEVVENVLKFVDKVVVVNDGSNDNTSTNAKKSGAEVVNLLKNSGVGYATKVGCEYAIKIGADIIVTIDADGQHNPEDIPKLINPLLSNEVDIVFGIRKRNTKMPLKKIVGNYFLYLTSKFLFGSDIYDVLTGFHAFKKEIYNKLKWQSQRYSVVVEFVYRTMKEKLKYEQVFVETIYNCKKKNCMKISDGLKLIVSMLKWKFEE